MKLRLARKIIKNPERYHPHQVLKAVVQRIRHDKRGGERHER